MGRYDGLITGKATRMPGDFKPQIGTKAQRKKHTPGQMNRSERKYADILELRRLAGEILAWQFEAITLKLADKPPGSTMRGLRIVPDFAVWMLDSQIEFHEVKGHREDKWIATWKVAIERYPHNRFVLAEVE
jgi:hypothetical protein